MSHLPLPITVTSSESSSKGIIPGAELADTPRGDRELPVS